MGDVFIQGRSARTGSVEQILTNSGTVLSQGFGDAVAEDLIKDNFSFTVYGNNVAVGTTPEPIAATGESTLLYPDTPQQLSLASTDAADTFGVGTGAWTVIVNGLDENWDPISEAVNLNGTTPVLTTNNFLRINAARLVAVGTSTTNAGDITLTLSSPAGVGWIISAGTGADSVCSYSVPKGFRALIKSFDWAIGRQQAGVADLTAVITNNNPALPNPIMQRIKFTSTNSQGTSSSRTVFDPPLQFPEYTDLWIEGVAGTSTLDIVGLFGLIIVDEEERGLSREEIFGPGG